MRGVILAATMSDATVESVRKGVEVQLKLVLQDLGHRRNIHVLLMGSQFYGLALTTSDVDMAVALNELSPR